MEHLIVGEHTWKSSRFFFGNFSFIFKSIYNIKMINARVISLGLPICQFTLFHCGHRVSFPVIFLTRDLVYRSCDSCVNCISCLL